MMGNLFLLSGMPYVGAICGARASGSDILGTRARLGSALFVFKYN